MDARVAAQQVRDAEARANARATAVSRRQTTRSSQRASTPSTSHRASTPSTGTSRDVPVHLARRHGDRIRQGYNRGWRGAASAATWSTVPAAPGAFLPRPQLLETTLGQRVRRVSRDTLAQVRRFEPGSDFRQQWHCFHAVMNSVVTAQFLAPLNRNLWAAGKPVVTPDELVRWIATFLLRCAVPYRHAGAVFFVTGANYLAVPNLVPSQRFQDIQSNLTLTTGRNSSEQVWTHARLHQL